MLRFIGYTKQISKFAINLQILLVCLIFIHAKRIVNFVYIYNITLDNEWFVKSLQLYFQFEYYM